MGLSLIDAASTIAQADQSSLSKIENGKRTINTITLYKISRGLNVEAGEFYKLSGVPNSIKGDLDDIIIPVRSRRKQSSLV